MATWNEGEERPLGEDITEGRTLPARFYSDPEIFELEQEKIFRNSWQYVGTTAELDEVGDYKTVDVGGNEIIVVNTADGHEAYYNVCPHRGAAIMDDSGNASVLQCPYHGWSFDLDGDLVEAPNWKSSARNPYLEDDEIPDLDAEEDGLCSVEIESVGPCLFVNLSDDPTPFEDFIGDVPELFEKHDLYDLEYATSTEYHTNSNWKFWIDNYVECDHCAHCHTDTLFPTFDMEAWDTEICDYYWKITAPAKEDAKGYNPEDGENKKGEYVIAWPNWSFNINPGPGGMCVGRIKPIDHETSVLKFDYLFPELGEDGEMTERQRDVVEWFHSFTEEDAEIVERQQRGFTPEGGMTQGKYGPMEHASHDFNKMVLAALNDEPLTERSTLKRAKERERETEAEAAD